MSKTRRASNKNEIPDSKLKGEDSVRLSLSLLFLSILLFALALRLPTFFLAHNETDELIYLTLAEKISQNFFDYTLQGTALLSKLPKGTYDHPLFLRPPLFVYLLAFFRTFHGELLLPVLSGLGVLCVTFSITKKLTARTHVAILAILVLAFCPILLFASVRILIDALLALLVSLSVLFFILAIEKKTNSLFVLAGATFGLAVLTKETAVLVLPVLIYLIFKAGVSRNRFGCLLLFGITALLISSPWYFHFYKVTGAFFRGSEIGEENLQIPFVRMMVNQSWHFYFSHLVLLAPIYLFGYFEIIERLRKRESLVEAIWVLSYFIPLTFYGLSGQGYQTRYILPAIPALAVLTADGLYRLGHRVEIVAAALLSYGLWTGILNSLLFKLADLFTPIQFIRDFFG